MATAHRIPRLELAPELAESFAMVADDVANDRHLAAMLIEIAFLRYEVDGFSRAIPPLEQVRRVIPVDLLTVDQIELVRPCGCKVVVATGRFMASDRSIWVTLARPSHVRVISRDIRERAVSVHNTDMFSVLDVLMIGEFSHEQCRSSLPHVCQIAWRAVVPCFFT